MQGKPQMKAKKEKSASFKHEPMDVSSDTVQKNPKNKTPKANGHSTVLSGKAQLKTRKPPQSKKNKQKFTKKPKIAKMNTSQEVSSSSDSDNETSTESKPMNDSEAQTYFMLSHIKGINNCKKLQIFLSKNDIKIEAAHWIQGPVAFLQVPSVQSKVQEIQQKFHSLTQDSPVTFHSASITGNIRTMLLAESAPVVVPKHSIFVTRLPLDTSKTDLKHLLPSSVDPNSCFVNLIHGNPDYPTRVTGARMDFRSTADATAARNTLDGAQMGSNTIKATVYVEKAKSNSKTTAPPQHPEVKKEPKNLDLRQQTRSICVRNLPSNSDYKLMKQLFPTGKHFDLKCHGSKNLCFVQFGTEDECCQAFDAAQGRDVGGTKLVVDFVSTKSRKNAEEVETELRSQLGTMLKVTNLPYSFSKDQIQKEFPTATQVHVEMRTPTQHKGSCFLTFNSKEDCETVFDACKFKKIDGRLLKCLPVNSLPVEKEKPKKEKAGLKRKAPPPDDEPVVTMEKKAKKATPVKTLHKIQVSNAPFTVKEHDMKQYFPDALEVTLLKGDNGMSKGVFMVGYATEEQCQAALKSIYGTKIAGRALRASMVKPAEEAAKDDLTVEDSPKKKGVEVAAPLEKGKHESSSGESEDDGDDDSNEESEDE